MIDKTWLPEDTSIEFTQLEDAYNKLLILSEEERTEVFHRFCIYCGSDDPKCQCWNDE